MTIPRWLLTVAEVASGKEGHAQTTLQIQFMSWVWRFLIHACVAIVAALTDSWQSQTLLAQARPVMPSIF